MARISEEDINEIRNRADIVDVISHYLQVQRKGKSYKAICPFHDDHNPSMNIDPERQIYKCFVCGAGGGVFGFVQNYEKISFPEAVSRVADLVGYEMTSRIDATPVQTDPRRDAMHKVLEETVRYTMYQLNRPEARDHKDYLSRRGIDEQMASRFEIGYDPGPDSLYRFLHAKGYKDSDMNGANVVRFGYGEPSDVFSGRITFPIHDLQGRPIGFSARSIDPGAESKYINTNETELFTKGDIVYNSHRARQSARREAKIYVCEGVTDVIAFARAGIENAVCTLGTSCTTHQINVLRSLAARTVFCYDGDKAGQAATFKAAKLARKNGCQVSVVLNQTGLDPDEIIRNQSAEALREMVKKEMSWMEFVISYLASRTNLNSYLEKKQFADAVMAEINELTDETEKQYFTAQLADMTGFRLEYDRTRRKEADRPLGKLSVPRGDVKAEELILAMMLNSPAACRQFEEELGYLNYPDHQTLAMMIVDAHHTYGKADPAVLADSTEDQNIRNLITGLASDISTGQPFDPSVMNGAIRKVKITVLNNEADAYKKQLASDLNPQSRELILNKYANCLRELRRYIDEENNQ